MYLPSGKLAAWKSCSNLSKASLMTELSGSIEEGPLGLSSWQPFSSSRPMTEVEDLGIDSLGSGSERMRLKCPLFQRIGRERQTELLPYNKGVWIMLRLVLVRKSPRGL